MKSLSMLMASLCVLGAGASAQAATPILSPRAIALFANAFSPAFGFDFAVTGQFGASPSSTTRVYAGKTLKVRISALAAEASSLGTAAPYGCVQYQVSAGGLTLKTQILAVPGMNNSLCAGAPQSQVLDLSSALVPGTGDIDVTVSASGYDYFCQLVENGALSLSYEAVSCPVRSVYRTHVVRGVADFQVQ
jgi:hypothetical protein